MIFNTLRKKNFFKIILSFIYFLRYLILIFLVSTILILTIPKLSKHVNKIDELNNILKYQHGFVINKAEKIEYNIFPQPNLEIQNPEILISNKLANIKLKKLNIFLNIKGFYSPADIVLKKIKFYGDILGNDIIGYYKPKKNINLLYLKVKDLGIVSKVFLDNEKIFPKPSGKIELKILDDNHLINFDYDKKLKINSSIYKNRNIVTNYDGYIKFEPFFYFKILIDIKKANYENLKIKKFYNIVIDEILNSKLNGELTVIRTTNKIIGKKITNNKISLIFSNGNIISSNSFINFMDLNIQFNFYLKKYSSFKNLEYELLAETENISKFLKTIGTKNNTILSKTKISIKGKINLDAQKYYFDKVTINNKNIDQKKLKKLENYLDKSVTNLLINNLNKENIYLFLKDLIEFI